VPAIYYSDLSVSYTFNHDSDHNTLQAFLTVDNVFNQQPSIYISIARRCERICLSRVVR